MNWILGLGLVALLLGTSAATRVWYVDSILGNTTNGALNVTPNGTGDLTLDGVKWPQAGGTAGQALVDSSSSQTFHANISGNVNCALTASISSNTLVTALKNTAGSDASATSPCVIDFRSATASSGTKVFQAFTAASSVTAAAADGMGAAATTTQVYVYALQDTTSELCYSTKLLDDQTVISATAFTGGAEITFGTLYCTNAHTSRPIKALARIKLTWSGPNWGSITEVSQAPFNPSPIMGSQFIASGYIAGTANCTPARTSTTVGAFTDDTDCVGVTVQSNPGPGTLATTDANNIKFTITALPAGTYRVLISSFGSCGSAGSYCSFAVNDGSTTGSSFAWEDSTASRGGQTQAIAYFTYTAGGDRTFSLFGAASSGTVNVDGSQTAPPTDTYFEIVRAGG